MPVFQSQAAALEKIVAALDLVSLSKEGSPFGEHEKISDTASARVQCYEASGTVAFCSRVTIRDTATGFASDELTVWCGPKTDVWRGPKTDVPHFRSRVALSSNSGGAGGNDGETMALFVDFMPRLDGGFDAPKLEDGITYAPPTTRKGFTQAGHRADYDARFFTADVRAFVDETRTDLASALAAMSTPISQDRVEIEHHASCTGLLAGPLALSMKLQLASTPSAESTASNKIAEAITRAADVWLTWMIDDGNTVLTPGNAVGWQVSRMAYSRDCEVRKQMHTRAREALEAAYGSRGLDLAAAENGRMDQVGHNTFGLGRVD
eukprot:CAMPEP_0171995140 /NCGR_PEP_ID=MMETSP0993-20121228/279320_1 /TAXON_ID=483369 /ORGANISM="non described non described, Strain CCMP2098" /LENGTH=321 /DNA_ID=CAMNT_0012648241 /DNA_START=184 /DNA_END=1149 /DNA_ORIENTATION=+